MSKILFSFFLLTLLTIAVVGVSFQIIGSPFDKRLVELDNTRVSQFRKISNAIENYYRKNTVLPENLDSVKSSSVSIIDPETKKPFEYNTLSSTSYNLCTTFSKDAETQREDSTIFSGQLNDSHKKGHYCYEYTIENTPTYRDLRPSPSMGELRVGPAEFLRNKATFRFDFTGISYGYQINISTVADMSTDVYMNFATGRESPIISLDPQKWDKYSCGKTLYWKVISLDTNAESEIQTATVKCN